MPNFFLSLENVDILINSLIDSNKDALSLKYINKLLNDLINLLNDSNYFDVEITVGENENRKIFRAHSTILKSRSLYYKTALSNNWVKKSQDGIILLKNENISSKMFEILLSYMYSGVLNVDNLDTSEIIELLEACDALSFNELIEDLQNHLLTKKKEWAQKNLFYLYEISSKHQSFNLFKGYCNEMIDDNPEVLLKSDDIASIEKSMLITILERDDLELDEINIWDHVLRWGIGQTEDLRKDVSEWNKGDFKKLKDILDDIIPLLRYNKIKSKDFYKKIKPYRKTFNKNMYEEILQYYLTDDCQPKLLLQKGRIRKGLLNYKMKLLISSWIDEKNDLNNLYNLPYDFELILRGTQKGFSRLTFEENCFNIKQTIVIMKIKETGELIGGYNPVYWNLKEISPDIPYQIKTDKSFIFKMDLNQIKNTILSRAKKAESTIHHNSQGFNLTFGHMQFCKFFAHFGDLTICKSAGHKEDKPYCLYLHNAYKNDLNLKHKLITPHLLEELEVYKLVKKN